MVYMQLEAKKRTVWAGGTVGRESQARSSRCPRKTIGGREEEQRDLQVPRKSGAQEVFPNLVIGRRIVKWVYVLR